VAGIVAQSSGALWKLSAWSGSGRCGPWWSILRSDCGLILQIRRFLQASRDYRLKQNLIAPYMPEQNWMIERFFFTIRKKRVSGDIRYKRCCRRNGLFLYCSRSWPCAGGWRRFVSTIARS